MLKQKVEYTDIIGMSESAIQVHIGQRAVGKTYSALSHLAKNTPSGRKFIYMRRTAAELDTAVSEYANPFRVINAKENTAIYPERSATISVFRDGNRQDEEGNDLIVGYALALSTFAGKRGIDFSDADVVVFDEFISEKHVHRMKYEGQAFLHFYESVNRNRELEGKKPLQVYLLANAISLNNDILLNLNIVSTIAYMLTHNQHSKDIIDKSIFIHLINNKNFTDAKKNTVLYRISGESNFTNEALLNQFTGDDMRMIVGKKKLGEYIPQFMFSSYTVFMHKNNGMMYIAKREVTGVQQYQENDRDILYTKFAPRYRILVIERKIEYDDYDTKLVFDALTKRR